MRSRPAAQRNRPSRQISVASLTAMVRAADPPARRFGEAGWPTITASRWWSRAEYCTSLAFSGSTPSPTLTTTRMPALRSDCAPFFVPLLEGGGRDDLEGHVFAFGRLHHDLVLVDRGDGPHQLVIVTGVGHRHRRNEQAQRQDREKEVLHDGRLAERARAFSRTCSLVQPDARRSRMPVSSLDLLSFCVGDFMTSA